MPTGKHLEPFRVTLGNPKPSSNTRKQLSLVCHQRFSRVQCHTSEITTRGRPVHTWCQTVRQGLSGRFSEKVELAHTPRRHNFHKFSNKDVGWTCTSACPSRHKIAFPRVNLAPFQKGRQVDFHGFSLWWCQVRFGEGMVSLIRSSNGTCGSTSFVEIAPASFCNAVEGSDDLELGMISNPQP